MTTSEVAAPSSPAPVAPEFFDQLFQYRKLLVRSVVGVTLLTALAARFYPSSWTARGSFVAQAGRPESLGSLAGLASQFGVNLGGGGAGYPPRFFASLVTSDHILGIIAAEPVEMPGGPRRTVEGALGIDGKSPAIRRSRAVQHLRRKVISALYDQRDGLTSFAATTRSAALSATIAATVVREINRFSAEQLQAHASTERKFVEARRAVVGRELAAAEEALSRYLTRNRQPQLSPERKLEVERLNRRVSEAAAVFTSLSESFEKARIEEVRDTPVLTLIDVPAMPALADRRPALQWAAALGFLTALLLSGTFVMLQRTGLMPGGGADKPRRFADWWPILRQDLTHPWRLLF